MHRWLRVLALGLLLTLLPSAALADVIVHSEQSASGPLTVSEIPWQEGEKIEALFELTVTSPLQQLTVKPEGNAWLTEPAKTGKSLAAEQITVSFPTPSGQSITSWVPEQRYAMSVAVTGITTPGIYTVNLIASGLDTAGHPIPPTKIPLEIRALPGLEISQPNGDPIVVQWTNLELPFWLPSPVKWLVDRMLPLDLDRFLAEYNPMPQLALKVPAGDPAKVTVTMDPVLSEEGREATTVSFWAWSPFEPFHGKAGHDATDEDVAAHTSIDRYGEVHQTVPKDETFYVEIFRQYHKDEATNRVTSPRIPPGKYKTKLHVRTQWGELEPVDVTINVRDGAAWPAIVVILGILLSFIANTVYKNQVMFEGLWEVYRAQRRYRRAGFKVTLIEQLLERINIAVAAGKQEQVQRLASLLTDLTQQPKYTAILSTLVKRLAALPDLDEKGVWEKALGTKDLQEMRDHLRQFCEGEAAATGMVGNFAKLLLDRGEAVDQTPFKRRPYLAEPTIEELSGKNQGVLDTTNVSGWFPIFAQLSFAFLVVFLLVGASVVMVQLSQVYEPNVEFGSFGDYLGLLFWGFAGDNARQKVLDLGQRFLPGGDSSILSTFGRKKATEPGGGADPGR